MILKKIFDKFRLIESKVIYSDDVGKLIGWNQKNNAIVLFSGSVDAEHVEDMDQSLQFPKDAIPELIEFLKRAEVI